MSASISIWLKDILPRTPGVVRSVAKRELLNTAREFYRQSTVWREVIEASSITRTSDRFTVNPSDATSEVFQIYYVTFNNIPLEGKSEKPVGERPNGTPITWYSYDYDTFELWPLPSESQPNIQARVFLIPKETATTLPDTAYSKYYEGILDGVLGRLYGHPAKPYSNPAIAEYHLRRFRNFIGEAAAEAKQGGFAGQNWKFPAFGK